MLKKHLADVLVYKGASVRVVQFVAVAYHSRSHSVEALYGSGCTVILQLDGTVVVEGGVDLDVELAVLVLCGCDSAGLYLLVGDACGVVDVLQGVAVGIGSQVDGSIVELGSRDAYCNANLASQQTVGCGSLDITEGEGCCRTCSGWVEHEGRSNVIGLHVVHIGGLDAVGGRVNLGERAVAPLAAEVAVVGSLCLECDGDILLELVEFSLERTSQLRSLAIVSHLYVLSVVRAKRNLLTHETLWNGQLEYRFCIVVAAIERELV